MPVAVPLKWHGGKAYLAADIIKLMPPRCLNANAPDPEDPGWLHYVEPYAGGLAVLLANDPIGISEVVGDLHKDLINFWKVIQGGNSFAIFKRLCDATPFSQAEWRDANLEMIEWPIPCEEASTNEIRAWKWFVHCRQSMSGRMDSFSPLVKNRTRRGMNENASAWLSAVDGLPAVHDRMKRVVVLCQPALDVIRQQDGKRTLFYIDAPYVHDSRSTIGEYDHEMTDDQHRELIDTLLQIEGRAIVSMYHHEIYDVLSCKYGWRLVEFNLPNNSASGKSKKRKVECLWMNYK